MKNQKKQLHPDIALGQQPVALLTPFPCSAISNEPGVTSHVCGAPSARNHANLRTLNSSTCTPVGGGSRVVWILSFPVLPLETHASYDIDNKHAVEHVSIVDLDSESIPEQDAVTECVW
eukprot:CAMPEP_0185774418 /NCGR_PEP_ID=MMETSP1174-20130828/78046_1 /TAXON_ID=35687 /ORGANISM="Dictyocha speculum, Strain CCMP1381" /LENGTH=118 /DNA_ID=CAMNT_0028461563 /DNA_START=75 /DNA_END=428 /DNA_ORIENTATION=+